MFFTYYSCFLYFGSSQILSPFLPLPLTTPFSALFTCTALNNLRSSIPSTTMAPFLKSLKFYFKSFVFGTLIVGCALYGVIASVFLRIIGKPEYAQYTVARSFYYSFSTLLGIKIKVKNEHYLKEKPAVVISNHQSALDILILGRTFTPGITVTAKTALKYIPFLGWFMVASGTFFLDRARGERARKILDGALASLKRDNRSLFMFPEGTRSGTTKLDVLPFKKGAFHLAKQAQIPVIPFVVSNTSNIFHASSRTFNTGEITIEVLPPISTSHLESNEELSEFVLDVRDKMKSTLERIGYSKVPGFKQQETAAQTVPEHEVEIEAVPEHTPLLSKD